MLPDGIHIKKSNAHVMNWNARDTMDPLSSCGAKRARTALGGETPALPNSHGSCTRDWTSLGADGPGGLIAELVLASDVADYVRFRAVCRPWRGWSPDPRAGGLDDRFLPRRWIMLRKAITGPRCYRFLNISTGECIRTDLPELAEHRFLSLTPEGLLLLLHESSLVVRLLNPLTRQLIDLPPITGLLTREQREARRLGDVSAPDLYVAGAGIVAGADASMVIVRFQFPTVLAIAKPGDDRWTVVHRGKLNAAIIFAGRFYCTNACRGVMILDTAGSGAGQKPRLRVAVGWRRWFCFRPMTHSLHLVDNGGELLLVHRKLVWHPNMDPDGNNYKYDVYRVDLNARVLVPVKSLNGRAVFMGMRRAVSVSVEVFPTVAADVLYLGTDCDEKSSMDGYNIVHGSNDPRHGDMGHPWTLVDCLSSCIHGSGKHVLCYNY